MTLVEVAKRAGVSKTTVSAILNKDPGYSYREETVQRVLESARQMGYSPNMAASALRAKRTYIIGIFSANVRGSCNALMTGALVQELKKHAPYKPMFVDPAVLREGGGAAFGFGLLEGLFWTLPRRDDALLKTLLAQSGAAPQVVTIGPRYPRGLDISRVVAGLGDGAYQATEHLLKLGHQRIAIIYRAPRTDNDRFDGYQRALKAHGVPLDTALCLAMPEDYSLDSYFRAGLSLTRQVFGNSDVNIGKLPTAVVCHNDEVALGVLKSAHRLGVKVPEELSVVGFDGVPLAEYSIPSLTTIEQPIKEQAAAAVRLMLARLEGKNKAGGETCKLACALRVGESSAPLRA